MAVAACCLPFAALIISGPLPSAAPGYAAWLKAALATTSAASGLLAFASLTFLKAQSSK